MLLQLLVELQADAHIYFGLVFFGIGYPGETTMKVSRIVQILHVLRSTCKVLHRNLLQ